MVRRFSALLLSGAFLSSLLVAGTQAKAERVRFIYNGGRWSHSRHSGWHRYWGGPSIGFYYAPEPVYIVRGYDDPYYYRNSDYWYSRPEFGLRVDLGRDHSSSWRRDRDRDYRYHSSYRYRNNDRYRDDDDYRYRRR